MNFLTFFMSKHILFIVLFAPMVGLAQWQFQAGIGPDVGDIDVIRSAAFDESTRITLTHSLSDGRRGGILASCLFKEKLRFRTGLEGQRSDFRSDIFVFQDDQENRTRFYVEQDELTLFIPIEMQYALTPWLYVNGGLMGHFMIDVTNYRRLRDQDIFRLSREQLSDFIGIVENNIRPINLSFRVGAGVKYRRIGLEFGRDTVLNNVARPLHFEGKEAKMKMKYSNMHFKFLYYFHIAKAE